MPSVANILDRFRRGAGVPAVVAEDVAAELAPIFAALDDLDAEAQAVREQALREAEHELAEADARRSEILAMWRERAVRERERVEADCQRASEKEVETMLVAAQEEARALRDRGADRLPAMVDEVLTCIRSAAR